MTSTPQVIGQQFRFQSGAGRDAWVFMVLVDRAGDYFVRLESSPFGNVSYDSLDIPESVVVDMAEAIILVKSGQACPSGTTGITGTTGLIIL